MDSFNSPTHKLSNDTPYNAYNGVFNIKYPIWNDYTQNGTFQCWVVDRSILGRQSWS